MPAGRGDEATPADRRPGESESAPPRTVDPPPDAADRPLVTIGLAVFNGERFLADALASLVGQSYPNMEILVGDNASTDRTPRIVCDFARADPRVRHLHSGVNYGAAWNFNRLVAEARGEYFRWAAADDMARPELVAHCVEALQARPEAVLAYPQTRLIDARGEPLGDHDDRLHLDDPRPSERFWHLLCRIGLCNPIYGLVRTDVLRRSSLLGAYPGSDIVLLAELALHGHFHEVSGRFFLRRFHEGATNLKGDAELAAHFHGNPDQREDESREEAPYPRTWHHLAAHLETVRRAPIPAREKARAVRFLLRKARWARSSLVDELGESMRHWLRRAIS